MPGILLTPSAFQHSYLVGVAGRETCRSVSGHTGCTGISGTPEVATQDPAKIYLARATDAYAGAGSTRATGEAMFEVYKALSEVKKNSQLSLPERIQLDSILTVFDDAGKGAVASRGGGSFEERKMAQAFRQANARDLPRGEAPDDGLQATGPVTSLSSDNVEPDAPSLPQIDENSSYAELFAVITVAISTIQTKTTDFYTDAMGRYSEVYESYTNNVVSAMGTAASSANGDDLNFNQAEMDAAEQAFEGDVDTVNAELAADGPVPDWNTMSQSQKDQVAAALSPALNIDPATGIMTVNTSAFEAAPDGPATIDGSTPDPTADTYKVSQVAFSAWQESMNSVKAEFDRAIKQLAQSASQSQNIFNEVVEQLTGTIKACMDSAGQVVANI